MELVLVRHGRPHRTHEAEGPADPGLDELGRRQARAVAEWLAEESVDALYTSPLCRAVETAAPIAEVTGLDAEVDDDVAEWDRDASEYIPTEQLPTVAPHIWKAMAGNDFAALGIDLDAFLGRVERARQRIVSAHPSQRVVVVCHGGVINAMAAHVLGLDRVLFFDPDYTSVSRLVVSRSGAASVRSLNERAHLRPFGSGT
ncbi:MAG: histidine phosphatase family protein [Acidimicrobiia bacterium]|nr:histidine phosphatase family protein [Acidimicrobiia bacterium]